MEVATDGRLVDVAAVTPLIHVRVTLYVVGI